MNKTVHSIYSPPAAPASAGAVPVKTLFNHVQHGPQISPFLRLEHTGPLHFAATQTPRTIDRTLCRGWALLSIVYSGALSYSDSTGASGTLGPGDVQWSRAGNGLERHDSLIPTFADHQGALEVVQLWVNIPPRHRLNAPQLHNLCHASMPAVLLPQYAGVVRVIAGHYRGYHGAARTHASINVWDVRLRPDAHARLELPTQHTLLVMVVHGSVHIGGTPVHAGQWAHLSRAGQLLVLHTEGQACDLLVLSGAPLEGSIASPSPLPLNTLAPQPLAGADVDASRLGTAHPLNPPTPLKEPL